MTDWSFDDEWEPSDSDLATVKEIKPWQRGELGKGLLDADGSIIATWAINDYGEPHHNDVASELGTDYAAKFDIYPSGACYIPSPDEDSLVGVDREWAESALEAAAPQVGLKLYRGFTAQALTRHGIDMQAEAHASGADHIGGQVEGGQLALPTGLATEGDLAASGDEMDHPPSISRMAAETRSQLLRRAQALEQQYGPDQSQVVHTFPDGWTMKQLHTYGDMEREGQLMNNCFTRDSQYPKDVWDYHPEADWEGDEENARFNGEHPGLGGISDFSHPLHNIYQGSYFSLRDPHNLPHVSVDAGDDGVHDEANVALGRHNADPRPEYHVKLADWARQTGTLSDMANDWDTWAKQGFLDQKQGKTSAASTGSIEDELRTWLDSFSAPSSTVDPLTIHHQDASDFVQPSPSSAAETPHVDPPEHPYEPYDWAQDEA